MAKDKKDKQMEAIEQKQAKLFLFNKEVEKFDDDDTFLEEARTKFKAGESLEEILQDAGRTEPPLALGVALKKKFGKNGVVADFTTHKTKRPKLLKDKAKAKGKARYPGTNN